MKKKKILLIIFIGIMVSGIVLMYSSYALFSANQINKSAITIKVGTLTGKITSSALNSSHQITVAKGETKELEIKLENPNTINAKITLYYKGNITLPDGFEIGYSESTKDVPPGANGYVMGKGSSKTISVVIKNNSSSNVTITFGTGAGLETPSLSIPSGTFALTEVVEASPIKVTVESGMIPVKWNGTTLVKADASNKNNDWYDYDNQKWANAVMVTATNRNTYLNASAGTTINTADVLQYLVYIPRFKYAIPDGSGYREIDVVFQSVNDPVELGTATGKSYYTHPAFWWDKDNDRVRDAGEEIKGFWIGKFELTGTTSQVTTLPNKKALNKVSISNYFRYTKTMQNSGNIYGYGNDVDTHLIKNSEWAAVAYLATSRYGKYGNPLYNGAERRVRNNNTAILTSDTSWESTLTGCSSSNPPPYTTWEDVHINEVSGCANPYHTTIGQMASTTGNIYGVYDMVGGNFEYVMASYKKNKGDSGFQDNLTDLETKYYDLYTYTPILDNQYAPTNKDTVCSSSECLGHAITETQTWENPSYSYPFETYPWMLRGGVYMGNGSNIFSFIGYNPSASATGKAHGTISSRLTVASLS